jgi:hypothetical protein
MSLFIPGLSGGIRPLIVAVTVKEPGPYYPDVFHCIHKMVPYKSLESSRKVNCQNTAISD